MLQKLLMIYYKTYLIQKKPHRSRWNKDKFYITLERILKAPHIEILCYGYLRKCRKVNYSGINQYLWR